MDKRMPIQQDAMQRGMLPMPGAVDGEPFDGADFWGRWFFDWTVFRFGAMTSEAKMASQMWLLLMKLASRMKSCRQAVERVPEAESRGNIEEAIDVGDGLWEDLEDLMSNCAGERWKCRCSTSNDGPSETEMSDEEALTLDLVEWMFGRERDRTAKFLAGVEEWSDRFDTHWEVRVEEGGISNRKGAGNAE
jgi:hypothetical protein